MKKVFILLVMVAVFGFTGVASATLTTIGTATYDGSDYKLIYEDDQGLIWLDYSKGPNHWEIQMDWVSGLNVSGVLTYNLNPGISVYWGGDWRLPESGWDIGYYKTTSEMGHLYYISLGNKGWFEPGGGLKNTGPFNHLWPQWYWSGNFGPGPLPTNVSYFIFNTGNQSVALSNNDYYAVAVRPGDVVPEPATMLLLGSGLIGLAGYGRKKFFKK